MNSPIPVLLVGGLAQDLVDRAAHEVLRHRPGTGLAYRVALDGPAPILVRTRTESGVCVSEEPIATSHGCIACAVRDDVVRELGALAGVGRSDGQAEDAPNAEPTGEPRGHEPVMVVLPAGSDPACLVDPLDLGFLAIVEGRGEASFDDGTPLPLARITAVVSCVDGTRVVEQVTTTDEVGETDIATGGFGARPLAELALETLRLADVVVVDGLGTSADPESAQALTLLAHVAPHGRVIRSGLTALLLDAVSTATHDPTRTDLRHEPLGTPAVGPGAAHGVATDVWTTRRPLHPQRLMDALEDLADAAVALDGPVWLAGRPHELVRLSVAGGAVSVTCVAAWLAEAPASAWEQVSPWRRVQSELDWDPYYGDRACRLVALIVGGEGQRARVRELLDALALDDVEMAAGPDAWAAYDDPFAPWLGEPWASHPELVTQPGACDGVHDHERTAVSVADAEVGADRAGSVPPADPTTGVETAAAVERPEPR
jgi:G3E family GTPase